MLISLCVCPNHPLQLILVFLPKIKQRVDGNMTRSSEHLIGWLLVKNSKISAFKFVNGYRMAPEVAVCETNKDNPYDSRVRKRLGDSYDYSNPHLPLPPPSLSLC